MLDWDTGLDLAGRLPGRTVFSPPQRGEDRLAYLDDSVAVVVLRDGDRHRLAEARRVAERTVVRLPEVGRNGGAASVIPRVEHVGSAPPALPTASVVIPTYDGVAHLEPCLRALASTLPRSFRGEVLVVDDGSGAETRNALARLEDRYGWLRVVRNGRNRGFITSCNRGAREAEGEYLVFLNDDTVPLPGWLEGLIQTFRQRPEAGAAGGRLIYPDGSLQEAGGVIYRDGSGANIGRGDYEVDAPLYRHVREVDYCSGALLATPRRLFEQFGGFDKRYRPAYYEDTDYCFRLAGEGRPVYYQPASTVVHTEGATSGTDTGSGAKRHQSRNRGVFRKRWASVLDTRPDPPGHYSNLTWVQLAFTGRPA
jgi:GT2 family glycosyltransferase